MLKHWRLQLRASCRSTSVAQLPPNKSLQPTAHTALRAAHAAAELQRWASLRREKSMSLNKRLLALIFVAFLLSLSGCSAHSPMIIKNTTDSSPVSTQFPPTSERVFITAQALPANVEYVVVSKIDVGKIWYGSSENSFIAMAQRARELGANAIIQARTWHQPSGFSWAAPHGSGLAVRIQDIKSIEPSNIVGSWY